MGNEKNTRRIQMEMPPQSVERLQALKEATESASYAEVVRNALQLYEALIDEQEKGGKFYVKHADGETEVAADD